jgi:hypothetical protein
MKKQLMAISLVIGAFVAANAFADDASTQMNGQAGQAQMTAPAPSTTTPATTDTSNSTSTMPTDSNDTVPTQTAPSTSQGSN